ncbi:uncharacterized protein EV154DRAFT_285332 [Mucor mucedo]|uniref:uncharacterized protein n=1 Tax=Mucor mucedo TaxID=29922 RepID=UPI00222003EE|nr:uncharacterized protein EV154DRAFT_285332 [Mucor mucedo]KAI7889387.1 hypothetical protein EV154DRAFT_285332 [Mucor mucedo]
MEENIVMEESNRIQTRRSSRSTRSASPVMAVTVTTAEEVSSPVSSVGEGTISTTLNEGRVTRSQSVESSGYETADSRKRKRKAKTTNSQHKKRADSYQPSSHTLKSVNNNNNPAALSTSSKQSTGTGGEDIERETRTSTQRVSKEARDAKKAQRDIIIRERLNELDKLEKAVKDGSHSEYHKLLSDIEQKRTKMLFVAEMRRSLAEGNVVNFFNAQKNAAYSQYYVRFVTPNKKTFFFITLFSTVGQISSPKIHDSTCAT